MTAEDKISKSFDFAADTVKQLIALSSAIIAFTVTFSKDILGNIEIKYNYLLFIAWGVFILSILAGIAALMALTGSLQPKEPKKTKEKEDQKLDFPTSINNKDITWSAGIQIVLFGIGIILTGVFGYLSLSSKNSTPNHKDSYPIRRTVKFGNDTTKYIDTIYFQKNK